MTQFEQWFTCRWCETEYPLEEICQHEGINHVWCMDCCDRNHQRTRESYREDLD